MSSKNGNAAAAEARGIPEFDLLASGVDRENNSTSESTQAASSITVPVRGPAAPKRRPRFTRTGFIYSPAKTRKYEAHGRLAAQLVMGDRPPLSGAVCLAALVELPIPASWSKRRTAAAIVGGIRPTSRPDVDNFLKSAMDAINGIVVADDSMSQDPGATTLPADTPPAARPPTARNIHSDPMLWDRLNDPRRWPEAPQSTYDAALFELREYGITQLEKPNCQRRLAMLSPKQLEDITAALLRLQPCYQTITDELIATLREIS
jgi:Holliday junction resolvase RusA-like endonuclease